MRAWAESVNANDNASAARLFASDARVVDGRSVLRLRTFDDALRWHVALTCSHRVVVVRPDGERVRAAFVLGNRRRSRCDDRGARTQVLFHVRDGKIVLWHELERGLQPEEESA